ncbi:MAG: DUF4340 domain-containing protein [Proteobacteria bacterium]|nr:DUF4340 domain-containing protein [Pseudomonadota bacterium]
MKNRTVIVIVTIAVLLLAFIFLFERKTMTTGELAEREDRVFTKYNRDLVESLTVRGTAGEEIVLKREKKIDEDVEETWSITAPKSLVADEAEVKLILSAIDYLIVGRAIKGKDAKSEDRFGFGSPRLTASFTIRGEKTSFDIGVEAKGDKVYLAISDVPDVFYAVDKEFLASMDKEVDDLRSKKLVGQNLDKAVRVELTSKDSAFTLRRDEDTPWQVEIDGVWILAAEDQVSELIRTVGDLNAEKFAADGVKEKDLGKYGLKDAAMSIGIELSKDEKVTVRIGGPCPDKEHELYATEVGSGTVICAKDDFLPVFNRPVRRLREMRPAVFRDDDVTRITLSGGDRTLVLEKGEDTWKIAGKDDFQVEQGAVTDLLEALRETRASEIQAGDEATSNLGEPITKVTLTLAAEGSELGLSIFKGKENNTERIQRSLEPAVLAVPTGLSEKARPDMLAFRERLIKNSDTHNVEALRIEGAMAQELEKKDGVWKLARPVQVASDSTGARALAELLAEVKVERFAADKAGPKHGLAKPFAIVTARLVKENDGAEVKDRTQSAELKLEIGAKDGDAGRFARLAGDDETVFIVGSEYEDAVTKPLVARDLFQIDDTEVAQLALQVDGKELLIARNGDAWTAKDGSTIDKARLSRIVTDLGGIKTLRAVSFGRAGAEFERPHLVFKTWTQDQLKENKPAVITLGQKSDDKKEDGYYARLNGVDVTFVLPARIVDDLADFARGNAPDAGPN